MQQMHRGARSYTFEAWEDARPAVQLRTKHRPLSTKGSTTVVLLGKKDDDNGSSILSPHKIALD